jgi:hypothetical protein
MLDVTASGEGAGAGATTPLWREVAVAEPAEFEAVTATRIVEPTSGVVSA